MVISTGFKDVLRNAFYYSEMINNHFNFQHFVLTPIIAISIAVTIAFSYRYLNFGKVSEQEIIKLENAILLSDKVKNSSETYQADEFIQQLNLHAFRSARDIYRKSSARNTVEEDCWIEKSEQREEAGDLVGWGLRGVGTVLYLSFRGTQDELTDYITDMAVVYGTLKLGDEIFKVHLGFNNFVDSEYERIKKIIQNLLEQHDFSHLCITGHSLGGGVAQVFALRYIADTTAPLPLTYVPTFAAPTVHFIHSALREDGPIYKQWKSICLNFIYQFDVISFAPRSIPGILQHMKPQDRRLNWFPVVYNYFFGGHNDNSFLESFISFVKNIIGNFVDAVNFEYLKSFESVSERSVFLFHHGENEYPSPFVRNNSAHITQQHYEYLEVVKDSVNSFAVQVELYTYFAKNIEKTALQHHRLDSYQRAIYRYNKTLSSATMTCEREKHVVVPALEQ